MLICYFGIDILGRVRRTDGAAAASLGAGAFFRRVPMNFSAEVSQQEDVLALPLRPVFHDPPVRINCESVEEICLLARLHDGSFDQLLRLTLPALCHRAKHRIRDHAAVWWRVSGPLLKGSCMQCVFEPHHHNLLWRQGEFNQLRTWLTTLHGLVPSPA